MASMSRENRPITSYTYNVCIGISRFDAVVRHGFRWQEFMGHAVCKKILRIILASGAGKVSVIFLNSVWVHILDEKMKLVYPYGCTYIMFFILCTEVQYKYGLYVCM